MNQVVVVLLSAPLSVALSAIKLRDDDKGRSRMDAITAAVMDEVMNVTAAKATVAALQQPSVVPSLVA